MNLEKFIELLKLLKDQDCLHCEFQPFELDEDYNETDELTEEAQWLFETLN